MPKIGRNDPCPCLSGKKYKHCCQEKVVQQARSGDAFSHDPELSKIRRVEGEIIPEIIDFAFRRAGKAFLEEAIAEFGLWGEYETDEVDINTFFPPWVAFNWIPGGGKKSRLLRALTNKPLGLQYLAENAAQLSEYEQAFILAACAQPFSFWVIAEVVPGKSLVLRDIFLARTVTVKEASASQLLKPGDVVFARVVALEGQAIMVGLAPTMLPPRDHLRLMDLRDSLKRVLRECGMKLSLDELHGADPQLRRVYLDAVESLRNPPRPELRNTDGDPVTFVKIYFELKCSPEEAFEVLKSLSLESPDVVLENAARDYDGNMVDVSFDWCKKGNKLHEHWDNTILGNITIKGDALTAEVNSEKRAKKFRSEIKKRLGAKAAYKTAVYQSVESKLEEVENRPPGEVPEETEELESLPEVQELLKKQMEAHLESWYEKRIPALKNKSPIEAARTKAGRERLEALLCDFERRNENVSEPHLEVDVLAMRKKLGM